MKKRRYKVSREVYIVSGRDGKNYFIRAEDNTTSSLPRHRLIDLGATKQDKYKLAETIPEGYHLATKIINKQAKKLLVEYGDESSEPRFAGAGEIRKVDLRRHHPQIKTQLEKDFADQTTIRLTVPKHSNDTTIHLNLNH